MAMMITQEYMEIYVIKPMARRIADLEKKIDIANNNIGFLIKEFDKAIKLSKKK